MRKVRFTREISTQGYTYAKDAVAMVPDDERFMLINAGFAVKADADDDLSDPIKAVDQPT